MFGNAPNNVITALGVELAHRVDNEFHMGPWTSQSEVQEVPRFRLVSLRISQIVV